MIRFCIKKSTSKIHFNTKISSISPFSTFKTNSQCIANPYLNIQIISNFNKNNLNAFRFYSSEIEANNQKILDKSPISNLEHIYNSFLQNKQVMLSTMNMRPEDPSKEERVTMSWCPSVLITKNQANTYFGSEIEEIIYDDTPEDKPQKKKIKDFDVFQDHQLIFIMKKSSPHIKNLGINPVIATTPKYKLSIADKTLLEQRRQVTLLSSDVIVAKEFDHLQTGRQPPKSLISGELSIVEDLVAQNIIWRECFDSHPHVHWKIKQQDIVMFRFRNSTNVTHVDLSGRSHYYDAKELKKTSHDPLAPVSREFIKRLNLDLKLLQKICSKGYNLDLGDKVVFNIDRRGIHVFGKEKFSGVWDEYYLEYGDNEIFTEENQVQDFLFKMQTI